MSDDRAADIDPAAADRLLTTTRAVRRRLDLERPVDRRVILDCIAVAEQAPVGSNQPTRCRWVVVDDRDLKERIAAVYRRGWDPYASRVEPDRMDPARRRTFDSAAHLAARLPDVPVLVIPCVRRHRSGADPMPDAAAASVFGSVFPAVWSFCLALRARGLGSSLTTLHLQGADEVAALLGIPDDFIQAALLPVGHYTGASFRPVDRPPPERLTSFNGWRRS